MPHDDFAQKIADSLVKHTVISEKEARDLQAAFSESDHDNFTDFLLEEGLVDKEHVLIALSEYYQVPYMDVEGEFFDHLLLRDFPKEYLLRFEIIPYEIDQNMMIVVAADPANPDLLPTLGAFAPYDIQFFVGIGLNIQDAIKEFYDKSITDPDDMHDDVDEQVDQDEDAQEIRDIEEGEG